MVSVAENIQEVLDRYESGRWALDKDLFDYRTTDRLGYIFAQEVALPMEQAGVSTQPIPGSGGFIAGYYGDRRSDYGSSNKLDITFLEQNRDIVDMFIRPWIVAVSYFGLLEDDDDGIDLKCNISVELHSKGAEGTDKDFGGVDSLRKRYVFEDCVPYQLQPDKISYGMLSEGELSRTAAFTFSQYKIEEGSVGGARVDIS